MFQIYADARENGRRECLLVFFYTIDYRWITFFLNEIWRCSVCHSLLRPLSSTCVETLSNTVAVFSVFPMFGFWPIAQRCVSVRSLIFVWVMLRSQHYPQRLPSPPHISASGNRDNVKESRLWGFHVKNISFLRFDPNELFLHFRLDAASRGFSETPKCPECFSISGTGLCRYPMASFNYLRVHPNLTSGFTRSYALSNTHMTQ